MTRIWTKACEFRQIFVGVFIRFDDDMDPSLMTDGEFLAVDVDGCIQPKTRKNVLDKVCIF